MHTMFRTWWLVCMILILGTEGCKQSAQIPPLYQTKPQAQHKAWSEHAKSFSFASVLRPETLHIRHRIPTQCTIRYAFELVQVRKVRISGTQRRLPKRFLRGLLVSRKESQRETHWKLHIRDMQYHPKTPAVKEWLDSFVLGSPPVMRLKTDGARWSSLGRAHPLWSQPGQMVLLASFFPEFPYPLKRQVRRKEQGRLHSERRRVHAIRIGTERISILKGMMSFKTSTLTLKHQVEHAFLERGIPLYSRFVHHSQVMSRSGPEQGWTDTTNDAELRLISSCFGVGLPPFVASQKGS